MYFRYHEKGIEYEGVVLAWIHFLVTKTAKLSAMRVAFYRENLPNVINLLVTCFLVSITIFFQGLSIALPVRSPVLPSVQVNCLIKISNIYYGCIVLHPVLVADLYSISKLLYMNYGGNKLVNQLGTWKGSKRFIPDGGIAHYRAAPPTLSDLHNDPLHAFIYIAFMPVSCALWAVCWLKVCASSKIFCDRILQWYFSEGRRNQACDSCCSTSERTHESCCEGNLF